MDRQMAVRSTLVERNLERMLISSTCAMYRHALPSWPSHEEISDVSARLSSCWVYETVLQKREIPPHEDRITAYGDHKLSHTQMIYTNRNDRMQPPNSSKKEKAQQQIKAASLI